MLAVNRVDLAADVLRQALQHREPTVFHAGCTPEAVELLWDRTIDLVLIDTETIAAKGSALVLALAQPELAQVPVLFMSTAFEGGTSWPTAACRVGMLRKPVDLSRRCIPSWTSYSPVAVPLTPRNRRTVPRRQARSSGLLPRHPDSFARAPPRPTRSAERPRPWST